MKRLLVCMMFFCCACTQQSNHSKKETKLATVTAQTRSTPLYFNGTIAPLSEETLIAPLEGTIEKMPVTYGQRVDKNSLIFLLNSLELQKNYTDTLTEFLKAKDSLRINRTKFIGTKALWKEGLIAKNTYLAEKTAVVESEVSFLQSKRKLNDLLKTMNDSSINELISLNFSDLDKVNHLLNLPHQSIFIRAPRSGILLYPSKSSEDKKNPLTIGSAVKSGQVLGLIGDLSGLRVEIEIPEVDLNKISLGMEATITGVAFPNHFLHGKIISITSEASNNNNNGNLPSFTAIVEVSKLSKEEQAFVKVGMSAKIEITVHHKKELLIPINAVIYSENTMLVRKQDKVGHIVKQKIETGATTSDQVVVIAGLKEGEKVLTS